MTTPDGMHPPEAATVLVIEQDVLIRASVSAYLRRCGFKVIEASDADEAFAVLQSEAKVAVVFSDVGIAGDGFGLAPRCAGGVEFGVRLGLAISGAGERTYKECAKKCAEHAAEAYVQPVRNAMRMFPAD